MTGKVYLAGAGPGDTELITVKGLNCLKHADVIVYDSLINNRLLSYSKEGAEKIFAGKRAGNHTLPQEEINKLLVEKAKEGKIVVRLKGGDPFVFARGAEEALYLRKNNIEFEIIPGVTSAVAGAAYAGIPVTQRGVSGSFHIINGHNPENINFKGLVGHSGTLVFLMGFSKLENICSNLIKYGKKPETPVAVISNATCSNQESVTGTLLDIKQKTAGLETPAIIVVGEAVNLREKIKWFENKPLSGRNIIVTRAKHQGRELIQKIEQAGGNPIEFPTIEICPLKVKLPDFKRYNWIIFTSANAIELFFKLLPDIRELGSVKIAVIGESTAECIKKYCIKPDFMPDEFISEALITGLKHKIRDSDRVLLPKAEQARDIIAKELKKHAAEVDELVLYKTVIPQYNKQEPDDAIKKADSVCFTSPSSVRNFALMKNIKAYCLGPVTAKTAEEAGFKEIITAGEYTINGLMDKLTDKNNES